MAESTSIDFVNQPDDDGYYPLQWAALNNRAELLEYLLENNARVENKDSKVRPSCDSFRCSAAYLSYATWDKARGFQSLRGFTW